MKKTIKSLLAIAITAFAFTACSDVPEPYQIPGTGGGGQEVAGAEGTGEIDSPFNITAAIAKCKEIGSSESKEKYYVKGIVVTAGSADGTYGNVSFDMADKAGGTSKFKAFQVLGSDAKKLPEGYEVKVGDEVIVYGPMYNYNGKTPETAGKGAAYIYSINGTKTDGSALTPPVAGDEPKGTGTKDDPFNIAAAIKKCQEIGQTESTEKFYVKGIAAADASPDANYGNASIDLVDKEGATDIFKAFQVLGTDGKKMPTTFKISKGAEVVVYGPIYNYKGNTPETAGKGAAYIVTVNGQPTEVIGGGETPTPGEAKGSGTLTDPYNIAGIIKFTQDLGSDVESTEDVYFKGKVSQVKNQYVADNYGNATFYISEDGSQNNEFYCFRTLYLGNTKFAGGTKNIKVGDEVIICGKVVNYKGNTPETVSNKSYLYSLNGKTEAEPDEGGNEGGGNEGGGGASASNGTITLADFGLTNAAELTTLKTTDGIELVFAQEDGSNAPKYYTAGASARMYAKNSLTIKATKAMTKVVLTCTDNNGKAANGNAEMYGEAGGNKVTTTKDSDTQVTFSGFSNSTLKIVNDYTDVKSGTQLRIAAITITYAE